MTVTTTAIVKPFTAPILSDDKVMLVPLSYDHAEGLALACQDGKLWELMVTSVPTPNPAASDGVQAYIDKALSTPDRVAFAVIDTDSGEVIGSTSYHDILPNALRLEIGFTWYAKRYQRTHVNTACKRMLLRHAFDVLGYQTVGFRTDGQNVASQRAIERLGARKDGIIRGDRVRRDGSIGDTVRYSITATEWRESWLND